MFQILSQGNKLVNILVTLQSGKLDFEGTCQKQEKNTPLKLDEQHLKGLLKGHFNQKPREDSRAKKFFAILKLRK